MALGPILGSHAYTGQAADRTMLYWEIRRGNETQDSGRRNTACGPTPAFCTMTFCDRNLSNKALVWPEPLQDLGVPRVWAHDSTSTPARCLTPAEVEDWSCSQLEHLQGKCRVHPCLVPIKFDVRRC